MPFKCLIKSTISTKAHYNFHAVVEKKSYISLTRLVLLRVILIFPPLLCNPSQTLKINLPIIPVFLDMNIMLPGLWHLVSWAPRQASQSFQMVLFQLIP